MYEHGRRTHRNRGEGLLTARRNAARINGALFAGATFATVKTSNQVLRTIHDTGSQQLDAGPASGHGMRVLAVVASRSVPPGESAFSAASVKFARELSGSGRLDEAEAVLRGVLDGTPGDLDALIECGRLQRQRADREAALASFAAAAAAAPRHLGIKLEMVCDLRELDRLDEAEALLRDAFRCDPHNLRGLIELAHLRRRQGDRVGSLAAFGAALVIEPGHPGIKLELARDLRALDRLDEAEAVHGALLEADAGNVGALVERGHVRRRRQDPGGAVSAFEIAAARAPHNRDIAIELARDLQALGRIDEAEASLRRALAADPGHLSTAMQLGGLLRARGNRDAAKVVFRAAVEHNPGRIEPLVELAKEYWYGGDLAEADDLLRRALDGSPTHLDAMMTAAEWALSRGDARAALMLASRARECHGGDLAPYLVGSRAAAALLDHLAAAQWLNRAHARLGFRPEIAAAQVHLSKQFGDYAAARIVVTTAGEKAAGHFGFWMEFDVAFHRMRRLCGGRAGT